MVDDKSPIQASLFIGTLLTKRLALLLDQSSQWQINRQGLQITPHAKKDYIGLSANSQITDYESLRKIEDQLLQLLRDLCPELEHEKVTCCVFPTVGLG